jgi:hypothetical protein
MIKLMLSPRWLFGLAHGLAILLGALVLLAPLSGGDEPIMKLFARDPLLRRTALASGLALIATAWIFFRPPATPSDSKRSVPHPVIGA